MGKAKRTKKRKKRQEPNITKKKRFGNKEMKEQEAILLSIFKT